MYTTETNNKRIAKAPSLFIYVFFVFTVGDRTLFKLYNNAHNTF